MSSDFITGQVLTAEQLNGTFANHVDCRGGDVMEGPLFMWEGDGSALSPDGTDYLQGACRGWVREQLAGITGGDYLPLSGGTITGRVTFQADIIMDGEFDGSGIRTIQGRPGDLLNIYFYALSLSTVPQSGGDWSGNIDIKTGTAGAGGNSGDITLAVGTTTGGGSRGSILLDGNVKFTSSQGTTNPSGADLPNGFATVWKNTADGSVHLYYNDGGTLKGVQLT